MIGRTLGIATVAAVALAPTALAGPKMKACGNAGTSTGGSGLGVVNVKAAGVDCRTARLVAKRSNGRTARAGGAVWSCRITQAATGTEPGYIPRSKVSCRRGTSALVRFEWAS